MFAFNDYFEILRRLVSFDTQSSDISVFDKSNKELIEYAANFLEDLGFKVELMPLPNGKYNLMAALNGKDGGVMLSSHTDTVPCDVKLWQSDPFELIQKGEKLYGLGACDMKGFAALSLYFAKSIAQRGSNKPLQVVLTADEETSMIGAQNFINSKDVAPDLIIIGEPSSLHCISAHKGYMARKAVFKGKSCHSSDPSQGINAIKLASLFINELDLFERELKTYRDERFSVPYPTINIGALHGGDSINRVCAEAELLFDVRPTPFFEAKKIDKRLRSIIETINERFADAVALEILYPDIDVFDNKNRHILSIFEELLGEDSIGVNYCTEASLLKNLGSTVVFGPGNIANAHQIDEHIEIGEIEKCYYLLEKIYGKLY
ncbi:acetylornithine deacetylase [Succinatimonas hippei]|uniref:acetylornithine deacetylase n=1 Tax=Succinatimonas hippei TaxID=626938 RepID=UPI0026E96BBC|nr:acetylornithine deacetylase [Succinatimonas hippei]